MRIHFEENALMCVTLSLPIQVIWLTCFFSSCCISCRLCPRVHSHKWPSTEPMASVFSDSGNRNEGLNILDE